MSIWIILYADKSCSCNLEILEMLEASKFDCPRHRKLLEHPHREGRRSILRAQSYKMNLVLNKTKLASIVRRYFSVYFKLLYC